jgi:hypothetical protein
MTHAGCYGVKIYGVDKITFSGKDSSIPKLGMKIINEINKTIKKMGYDESLLALANTSQRFDNGEGQHISIKSKNDTKYSQ